jgi:hypothetical protein
MLRRNFLKTMLTSAMIAVGVTLDTYKPSDVKTGPTYLEVLREHEERAAKELAAAFEEKLFGYQETLMDQAEQRHFKKFLSYTSFLNQRLRKS